MNIKFIKGGWGLKTPVRQERVPKGESLQIAHLALNIENWKAVREGEPGAAGGRGLYESYDNLTNLTNLTCFIKGQANSHNSQDLQCDFCGEEELHNPGTYST